MADSEPAQVMQIRDWLDGKTLVDHDVFGMAREYATEVVAYIDKLTAALTYISSPTMALPGGRDAMDFAETEARSEDARMALVTCIRTARFALEGK